MPDIFSTCPVTVNKSTGNKAEATVNTDLFEILFALNTRVVKSAEPAAFTKSPKFRTSEFTANVALFVVVLLNVTAPFNALYVK